MATEAYQEERLCTVSRRAIQCRRGEAGAHGIPQAVLSPRRHFVSVGSRLPACAVAQLAKVRYRTKEQGQAVVLARRLGKQGGVPPYKSWSYLMRNEQANETGGRVFYTDATGAGRWLLPLMCLH